MTESKIIEMFFSRDERALAEVDARYARMYKSVLRRVLGDEADVDECANDVLMALWNSIPPQSPDCLSAYIAALARRTGIDRLRYNTRAKRSAEHVLLLSELDECLPAPTVAAEESAHFRAVLSNFVRDLDAPTRVLFLRRYVWEESVSELSERFGLGENHISVKLYRARKKLRKLLEKEGIFL